MIKVSDQQSQYLIENIAELCHNANRMICQASDDFSQGLWHDAPQWQKDSAINGVKFHIDNPDASPEDTHINWMREKIADGWIYGETKCPTNKTHPCIVEYKLLPFEQRVKDYVFKSIVDTHRKYIK